MRIDTHGKDTRLVVTGGSNWGKALPEGASVLDTINMADLNWKVQLTQLRRADGSPSPHHEVTRTDTGAVVGTRTVRKGFKLLQNERAFTWFQPLLDAGLATLEAAGSMQGGNHVWITAKFKGEDDVIVPSIGDKVGRRVLLAHAHDGTRSIRPGFHTRRFFCNNVLEGALSSGAFLRIRHSKNAGDALRAAQEAVMAAAKDFDGVTAVFKALAKRNFSNAQLEAFLRAVFPASAAKVDAQAERERQAKEGAATFASLLSKPFDPTYGKSEDELAHEAAVEALERTTSRAHDRIVEILESGGANGDLNLPGVRGTGWAAYNAVTEYLTHEHARTQDARMANVFFGNTGHRALQAAQDTFLG